MVKFKFRLQAALRLRQLRVDAENAKLQHLLSQRNRLRQALAAAAADRKGASQSVQEASSLQGADLRWLSSFTLGLEARSKAMREAVDELNSSIEVQQDYLRKAEQDKRVLEKLRDRRLSEWNLSADREIEATAQELWLLTHTTKKDD